MLRETGIISNPIEKIVKDPGLRRIYLPQALIVYDELWRKNGVDEESRIRNRDRLSKTINDPNLARQTAKSILSIIEPKLARPSNP